VVSGRLTILIPAYNEAETIGDLLPQLVELYPAAEILVVDDGSSDDTAARAIAGGARLLQHPYNKGNGASVKTGLRHATGQVVVIFDADGQHEARDIQRLTDCLGPYDLVVGARDEKSQTDFGRRVYHHFLNLLATYLSGVQVPDATSGFRAARRSDLMQFIHLLPNGFSTPVTTTLGFIKAGYSVKFLPTTMLKRQGGRSKIKPVRDGSRFFIIAFRMSTMFAPMKLFLPVSAALVAIALVYTVVDILFFSQRLYVTNTAVLLITIGILTFLIGLVAEQIAALRFERVGRDGG
jgi:glycosyltransferase involved in cell wall biosynthesis